MSQRFMLKGRDGEDLLLVEAADSTDATLYGFRNVPGFSGDVVDVDVAHQEQVTERMARAFRDMGLSESGAMAAARGRATGPTRPVIQVPRQEATGSPSKRITESLTDPLTMDQVRKYREASQGSRTAPADSPSPQQLAEAMTRSFKEIGLSEQAAMEAARGRGGLPVQPKAPPKGSDGRVVKLTGLPPKPGSQGAK